MADKSEKRLTREEAHALIAGLTREEKLILYEMLLSLRRNPERAEPLTETDRHAD